MIRPILAALALFALPLAAGAQTIAGDPVGSPAAQILGPAADGTAERDTRSGMTTVTPAQRDTGPTRACIARVIGLRPLTHYDHAQGSGFLAVREGPGSTFRQTGELYLGDSVSITDRRGNWYAVRCSGGLCTAPLWGEPAPQGWAYGRFLHVDCPD